MFTEDEQAKDLTRLTVQDAWIGLQLLDKAAGQGVIQPTEYEVLAQWRGNIVESVQRATGKNYDEELMKARQAQMQAAQEAQQAAAAELQAKQEEAAEETSAPKKRTAKKAS